jgi:hypothetical protein
VNYIPAGEYRDHRFFTPPAGRLEKCQSPPLKVMNNALDPGGMMSATPTYLPIKKNLAAPVFTHPIEVCHSQKVFLSKRPNSGL